MGTVTPPAFFLHEVVAWLRAKGLGACAFGVGLGEDGMGSISFRRLRQGGQGPVARHSVQDGFIEVRVDRHSSHVGNPFCGAPRSLLCHAYDDLLKAVLVAPLAVDECLREYEGLKQDDLFGMAMPTPAEQRLMQSIADRHGVKIHSRQSVRPFLARAWLVHHALLLVQGTSLALHCWCLHGCILSPPWACHSQSIAGALLWLAITARSELASACPRLPSPDRVCAYADHRSA